MDIVDKLFALDMDDPLYADAADEIERLRAGTTEQMIAAGAAVLTASDYGAPVRFQTDEDLIRKIYAAMQAERVQLPGIA